MGRPEDVGEYFGRAVFNRTLAENFMMQLSRLQPFLRWNGKQMASPLAVLVFLNLLTCLPGEFLPLSAMEIDLSDFLRQPFERIKTRSGCCIALDAHPPETCPMLQPQTPAC